MTGKCIKCGKKEVLSSFCRSHFIDYLEKKVRKTIRQHKLIPRKKNLGVAVSGGKDSTVLLYMLHKFGYKPIGITIDASIGNRYNNGTELLLKAPINGELISGPSKMYNVSVS